MLYQMVLADGIVDVEELNALNRIGIEKYGITPEQINLIVREANVIPVYPESLSAKISLLYQLGEIAWADGQIDDSEKDLMKKYIIAMGFDSNNTDEITDFILKQVKDNIPEKEVITQILND